jgi:hypothetical protein
MLPLIAIAVVLAVAVVALLVVVLVRPSPSSTAATPTPTPTSAPAATPTPGTSGSGEPASPIDQAQQHQQYRAYVSTVVQSGTSVIAGILGLSGCTDGRPQCLKHLNDASQQVSNMQDALQANPAPPCLSAADAQLQDSLTFQQKGLNIAHDAVASQNRLQLMQGLLLTGAGLYRGGQAIVSGRQANC